MREIATTKEFLSVRKIRNKQPSAAVYFDYKSAESEKNKIKTFLKIVTDLLWKNPNCHVLQIMAESLIELRSKIKMHDPYSRFTPRQLILRDYLATDRRTFLGYIRTALTLFVAGISFVTVFNDLAILIIGWSFIPKTRSSSGKYNVEIK